MVAVDFYSITKIVHVSLAISSGVLFGVRGCTVLLNPGAHLLGPARRLSFLIDSCLLAAALALLFILQIDPASAPWLLAKLTLLVAYIVLGSYALKRAQTRIFRALAFIGALLCFVSIYVVARSHDPLAFVAWVPKPW